jgi:hypothetical protein
MIRLVNVSDAVLRNCSPSSPVDTLLRLEGDATTGIRLEKSNLERVGKVADVSPEVAQQALSRE